MKAYSRFAGPRALRGLGKIGDVLCPGDAQMPRFSSTGFLMHADRVLEGVPDDDRSGLLVILAALSFLPLPALRVVVRSLERHYSNRRLPPSLRYVLSGLHFGLRGLIFSLYYSQFPDPTEASMDIVQEIKWKTSRSEDLMNNPGSTLGDREPQEYMTIARKVQPEIEALGVKGRVTFVKNLRLAMLQSRDRVIERIQKETRKSKTDALLSEIYSVLDTLAYFEKNAEKLLSDRKVHTPIALMGKKSLVSFDPLGVILVISPWNYPVYQAIIPSVLSFLCGNAVIFKPSEFTPLTGLVEELLHMAGFDPAWIQVIYGDGKVGQALIEQRPDKIFFTGSVATGKKIMKQASDHLIPVELELGGKDPMIVFEDVNLKRAAAGALWGALTNCGQACTSVERIYVQKSIYEDFRDEVLKQLAHVQQAVDNDGSADIGFMTTDTQSEIVRNHLADAKARGAKLSTNVVVQGPMVPPVVIEGATAGSKVLTEETFGPVIPLVPFESEAEAIELANNSEFGLSASVWSKDLVRAYRVARRLQTGNVSINNVMLTEGNPALPFGGVKNSGFGRYKGEFGFYSFSNIKSILIDKDSKKIEANWYPYTTAKYQLFDRMTAALFGEGGLVNFVRFLVNGLKLESLSQKKR